MQLGETFNANYYNFLNFRAFTVVSNADRDTKFGAAGTVKVLGTADLGFLIFNSATSTFQFYNGSASYASTNWIDCLPNVLASGKIFVGNSSGVATAVTLSGDISIDNAGVATINAGVIVNADINASAAIVDTKLATISTAGKVSNSATTATTADTNDAIVARTSTGYIQTGKTPSVANDVANKAYVDAQLATLNGSMVFKGSATVATINAMTTYNIGWQYRLSDAGTITLGSGSFVVEIGDLITFITARSGSGMTSSDYTISQTNIDGAVIGPVSATADAFALFNGTTGKLIKDSAITVIPINKGGTNNASLPVTANGVVYTDGSKLVNSGAPTASVTSQLVSNGGTPVFKQSYLLINFATTTTSTTSLTGVLNGFTASGALITDFNVNIFDNNGELVITKISLDATSTDNNPVFKLPNISSTTTTGWKLVVQRIKF